MHQDIFQRYQSYVVRHKRSRVLRKVVNVLACTVIFCTTYALILPAITMEKETFCGIEEHVHDETCRGAQSVEHLICTAQQLNIHTHSDSCYDAAGILCCGQADYVVHSHAQGCYDAEGNLVCDLPERSAHVHGDSCYVPGETEPEVLHVHTDSCYISQKGSLKCTVEEYEGHTHGESCYVPGTTLLCTKEENHVHGDSCYQYPLTCTLSTDPHVHSDGCYGVGELSCTAEEEDHVHGDGCYEMLLTCGKNEGDAHAHGDGCYSAEAQLICQVEENHVHGDSCYEAVLSCTIPEDPGHAHSDECWNWESVLSCGLEEGQEELTESAEPILVCTEPAAQVHVHGEGCFETVTTEAQPICSNEEEGHEHTDECYALVCGKEAHSHTLACYSDPEADVETAADWEATFAHVELTGKWNEDVVAIAESQLGYAESSRNYAVWADDTTHGYTRYGQWYGSPYGDWCAMYVSFCLNYAEVEGMPLHWGVRPWIEELTELKLYHEAEVYEPKPGDIIFYDWEGDDLSDHVGLVAEIIPGSEIEPAQVKAIEGNSSNCVQYVYYDITDERILGYSELPDNLEVYSCGILRHSHNEYCYDDAGNLICQQVEHTHEDSCEPRDVLYCGLEEHTHIETCYDEAGELICQLTEHTHNADCITEKSEEEVTVTYHCGMEEHTHAETCYDEAGELVCELAEHTHSEECTVEPVVYYCGKEEHTHAETCYDEAGNLICEITEHIHSEECTAEPVVYHCGLEEHTHIETCYDEAGTLICEIAEHTHNEECAVEPVVYHCGLEEHAHIETCYNEAGELVCELEEHTHDDNCLIQVVYFCGMQEHTHGEDCYDEAGNLICELPEHTHSEECTVKPVVYYCGKEEHTHIETCYNEAGELVCTLEEHTHDENCLIETVYFCGMQEHTHDEDCYNEAGELICQITEHVHNEGCTVPGGYICGLEAHTHDERCYDNEGNLICTIPEHTHTDECKAQNIYACGLAEHTHGEACYDAEGNLICTIPEHIHTAACVGRNLYYSDASIRVHAVIRGVENLPKKLSLKVIPVDQEQDPASFGSMQGAVSQEVASQEQYVSTASFYQLYLISEGQIYELPETASVTVTMEFEQPIFTQDDMADSIGTHAFMLTPEGGIQLPEALMEQEEVPAEPQEPVEEPTEEPSLVENVVNVIADTLDTFLTAAYALDEIPEPDNGGEEGDDALPNGGDGQQYNVSSVSDENYDQPEQGITSVTFTTSRIGTFAVALANTVQEGDFWERVYTVDDITSGGTYMIVSAEGSYALKGETDEDENYEPVVYQAVKGNTDYYTISDTSVSLRWTITANNGTYRIQNQGNSGLYLYLGSGDVVTTSNTRRHDIIPAAQEKCMRIVYDDDNVLQNKGDGPFGYDDENDDVYVRTDTGTRVETVMNNTNDMVIFKLSSTKELSIPSDVTGNSGGGGSSSEEAPDEPDYDSFITPSGGKSGNTSVSHSTDSTITVNGQYYSDPSTSNLEKDFRKDTYAASEAVDGMVRTDKSVIYADDDYNAFSAYAGNTFGVTLSVLGQEYPVPMTDLVKTPVDVVFVLDVSGSMSDPISINGESTTRAKELVDAVNISMAQIMDNHEANRVGMVLFSSGAWEMLPLDRYTAPNDTYLTCGTKTVRTSNGYVKNDVMFVQGNAQLKTESGTSYANAGSGTTQGIGTYTQAGIALGRKVFGDIGSDITYTASFGAGENQRDYTVTRQPVIILVSDGEPTHSTHNYADVLKGPHYGSGVSTGNTNGKGIHGYNTVLSANYYKRMVSIQYQKPALFYTIGMGIYENSDGPLYASSGTGDNYKRAVLNPTPTTIAQSSSNHGNDTIEMLEAMINSSYNGQSVVTSPDWPDSWYGVPHEDIPVVAPNPYAGNYSYTDHAFFGELSTEELDEIFEDILEDSVIEKPYGFVLYQNTDATVTDYIGAGMEVKGTPVLRYGGQNYTQAAVTDLGNGIKKYTYSGTYIDPYIPNFEPVDISEIEVYVTPVEHEPIYMCGINETGHVHTEEDCGVYRVYLCGHHGHRKSCYQGGDISSGVLICGDPHTHTSSCQEVVGTQRVQMIVPDTALPVYTPELIGKDYYYEQLPVRLIYQVGLTDDAHNAVLSLAETGGELTFYTNRWGNNQSARADLLPSLVNPFYYEQTNTDGTTTEPGYHDHTDTKTSNPTQTESYSKDCHWGSTIYQNQQLGHVYHELGNNGKLYFKADTVDIPVEKVWEPATAATDSVTVNLYKVTTDTNGRPVAEKLDSEVLTAETQWKTVFADLMKPNDKFYYAVAEEVPEGYVASFGDGIETVEISPDGTKSIIMAKITEVTDETNIIIINKPSVELPNTGGPGLTLYYTLGITLCGLFGVFYIMEQKNKRERR